MILINNILVAINNKKIYQRIIKYFNIEFKDVIYKEGILEILKKHKKINKIILSDNLLGEIKFEYLINKIKRINKNIEIIILLNNKLNIRNKKEKYNIKDENIYLNKTFLKKINKNMFDNKSNKINKKIIIIGESYKQKAFLINKINNIYPNIKIINFFYSKKNHEKIYNKKNKKIKINLSNNLNIINNTIRELEAENKYLIYNVNNYFFINIINNIIKNKDNIIYLINNIKEIKNIEKNKEQLNIMGKNKNYIILNNKLYSNKYVIKKFLKIKKIINIKIINNNKISKIKD